MAKTIFSTTGSKMIYDGTTYYVTDLSYDEKADKVDVTDTGTSGDGKEYVYTRSERTISVDLWKDSATLVPAIKTLKACTLQFEGNKWIGSASFDGFNVSGQINNAVKLTLNGTFQGSISQSLS